MVHENLVTIYIYTHIYVKSIQLRLFTHDKSETPTPRPITPNETCKKEKKKRKKKKKKATTFLIFQYYKEITIISYKVIIVISNTITHTHKYNSIPLIK